MYTYQVIGIAEENERTYESRYGTYSKKDGFNLSELSKSMTKEKLLESLFHEDCWSLKKKPIKMTKEEIEKKLGYEIEIDNDVNKKDKPKSSYVKNHRNLFADDIFSFFI